jgi:hypothetical protein
LALIGPSAVAAQQNWPVRCNLRTSSIFFDGKGFQLVFEGAAQGTRVRQPPEGQCAWEDRGWGSEEPETLTYSTQGSFIVMLDRDNHLDWSIPNGRTTGAERAAMTAVTDAW